MTSRRLNRTRSSPFCWDSPVCLTTKSEFQFVLTFEQLYLSFYPHHTCLFCLTYDGTSSLQRSFNHLARSCKDFRNGGFRLSAEIPDGVAPTLVNSPQLRDELSDLVSRYEAQIPATIYSRPLNSAVEPDKNGRFDPETVRLSLNSPGNQFTQISVFIRS